MADEFFDEMTEQSRVKVTMVSKYFRPWSQIIANQTGFQGLMAYVDLYAGPGGYEDGTPSTPLYVVEEAIANPKLHSRLQIVFNDADNDQVATLQDRVTALPGIGALRHRPQFLNLRVEDITHELDAVAPLPKLSFIDPFGFKGVDLDLLRWALAERGSDCLFFLNYMTLNRFLTAEELRACATGLFGQVGLADLRSEVNGSAPPDRESAVMDHLELALRAHGARYFLPFRFTTDTGTRAKQFLIHLTKNPTAHRIMKEIMAKESSSTAQGVASLEHNPAEERQMALLEVERPLDTLKTDLLTAFACQSLTFESVIASFERRGRTRYTQANYRRAVLELVHANKVKATRPSGENIRPGTLPKDVVIHFPPDEEPDG